MTTDALVGFIIEHDNRLSLADFSQACEMETAWIIELVDEGIIEPGSNKDSSEWRFTGSCLLRARVVKRLQRDLGINLAGAAMILDLQEEIAELRSRIEILG